MSVTVVIPCYNQGHLLSAAIESCLQQSRPPDEVVVVDDGSTDETASVCRDYGDSVTYIHQENTGLSAARNTAILHASSEFVQLLDADDLLRPAALARLLDTAKNNPGASVIRGSWEETNLDGDVTSTVVADDLGPDAFHSLFDPITVGPPCRNLVRRAALVDAGLFDTRLRSCEDWDMWLRIALAGGEFATSSDAFAVYRKHAGTMSRDHSRMWRSGATVLARARARHGCRTCHTAYINGIRRWRRYCYLTTLRVDVRDAVASRRLGDAFGATARAVRRDPAISGLVAASVLRSLGLRTSRAPHITRAPQEID